MSSVFKIFFVLPLLGMFGTGQNKLNDSIIEWVIILVLRNFRG